MAIPGRLRRLVFCLSALWLASAGSRAFVPESEQIPRASSIGATEASVAALFVAALSPEVAQAQEADDGNTSWGFNPFVVIVPGGVLYLLNWVFSLKPEMDADADGYKSTTLRGRDSEENLQRRIAEMEARLALEEKERQALIAGRATSTRQEDELDDDLFSSDLDAQLRAANKNG